MNSSQNSGRDLASSERLGPQITALKLAKRLWYLMVCADGTHPGMASDKANEIVEDSRPLHGDSFMQFAAIGEWRAVEVGRNEDGSPRYQDKMVDEREVDRGCAFGSIVREFATTVGLSRKALQSYTRDEWSLINAELRRKIDGLPKPSLDNGFPIGWAS